LLLHENIIIVSELSILQVVLKSWVEHREFSHTVSEAKTFLDTQKGEISLVPANAKAVLMDDFTHLSENICLESILVVAGKWIGIKSLLA
jgi:hypothetical protein